jgi:hypothetical protein
MDYQIIKKIQQRNVDYVENSYQRFLDCIREEEDPNILKFLEKYLEWHDSGNLMAFRMFRQIIPQTDELNIWGNLMSFVGNYFKDDSFFLVKWYKNVLVCDIEDRLTHVRRFECKDKTDMKAFPVVVIPHDYADGGSQDVKVILDAMEQYEDNVKRQEEYHTKWLRKIKSSATNPSGTVNEHSP